MSEEDEAPPLISISPEREKEFSEMLRQFQANEHAIFGPQLPWRRFYDYESHTDRMLQIKRLREAAERLNRLSFAEAPSTGAGSKDGPSEEVRAGTGERVAAPPSQSRSE